MHVVLLLLLILLLLLLLLLLLRSFTRQSMKEYIDDKTKTEWSGIVLKA